MSRNQRARPHCTTAIHWLRLLFIQQQRGLYVFNLKNCVFAVAVLAALPVSSAMASNDQTYAVRHASEPALAPGMGRIYFYRESSLMGVAATATIMIDGQSSGGRSASGDYFYVDVPAGTHQISTETEKTETTPVTVVDGQPVYVRTHVSMGLFIGHVKPEVVDTQTAQTEIADCDWHEPTPPAAPAAPAAAPAAAAPATAAPAPAPSN